jgi:hypothetical protein
VRRTTWLAAGVAIGVGGTLWAGQRVRSGAQQAVDRLAPEQLAAAFASVRRAGVRARLAIDPGRGGPRGLSAGTTAGGGADRVVEDPGRALHHTRARRRTAAVPGTRGARR